MRDLRRHAIVAVLAVAASASAAVRAPAAGNWADSTDQLAADPAYAASREVCRKLKAVAIPSAPRGSAVPTGCVSEDLYFGIGVPADPAAARRCAMEERAADPGGQAAFAGSAMLMTMFANGKGAPRDLDIATALACMLDGAPAEMDGRVNHLMQLKHEGPAPIDFSFCDDVTSGLYQGLCARHDSRVAAVERQATLDRLTATLAPEQKTTFAALSDKAEAFDKARSGNEIDLSGSGRAAFQIEAEDAVRDDLVDLMGQLTAGKLGAATDRQFAAEDATLNATYRAVMAVDAPQWGTVTADGIRAVQRAWLAYRDAFATFAAGRFGPGAAIGVRTWLTHRRNTQLHDFLS